MQRFSRHTGSFLLAIAGAFSAAAAVAALNLFPQLKAANVFLVGLTAVLFWASRRVAKSGHWTHTPLDLPILIIVVQMGLSFWATALPETTWIAACQLVAGLVAYYALIHWSQDRLRLWWAVAALIALGLGMALVAPIGVDWFIERKSFLPPTLYRPFRLLLSDPIHPNVMAAILGSLIPLPLALALALPSAPRRRLGVKGGLWFICLIELFLLLLTRSRGGYIATGVGLWLTLWLSGRRKWAMGLLVIGGLMAVVLVTRPQVQVRSEPDPAQAALDTSTWDFRQRVWRTALLLIGDFPFTGVGMGAFNDVAALLYGFYSPYNPQTHNLFLQVAVDLGLLGLIGFVAILLIVLWMGVQSYRRLGLEHQRMLRALAIGGLASVVATVVHGLVDSQTWSSKGTFIPWAIMGLVVGLYTCTLTPAPQPDRPHEVAPP
jgi:putative inorganic carbon (HCO3(-)) transporter